MITVEQMVESRRESGDVMVLRICDCGQVGVPIGADPFYLNRCGRDARTNMRHTCPVRVMSVKIGSELEPGDRH